MKPIVALIVCDRLAFCSNECVDNALESHPGAKYVRVSPLLAKVILCYGCGLPLDETLETN